MAIPKIYFKKRKNENEGQLYLYYSFGGVRRFEYYTGLRIEEKFYNEESIIKSTKPIKRNFPFAEEYNIRLSEMIAYALSLVVEENIFDNDELRDKMNIRFKGAQDSLKEVNENDFIKYLSRNIDQKRNGKKLISSGRRLGQSYKKSTIDTLYYLKLSLEDFLKHKKIKTLKFEDINMKFYNEYRDFETTVLKNKISTFAFRIKDIKVIMNEAIEDNVTKCNGHTTKQFITPSPETDHIALSLEDLKAIKDAELPKTLNRIRDLFLIACYSALRFSDLTNITIENLDDNFIRARQKKTGDRVVIPIMKDLRSILDKYNGGFPKGCTNDYFNKVLHRVIKHKNVGIDTIVRYTEEGKPVMKSDLVTSHTGRRTYATNMFKLGVPTLLIMSATGHTSEAVFLKYIKATNEDKAHLLAEWMKKLNI